MKDLEIVQHIVNEVFDQYTKSYFFWVGVIFMVGYCMPFYALMKLDFDYQFESTHIALNVIMILSQLTLFYNETI